MNLGIKNRVALITGGSKGIGFASAISLAKEGCNIGLLSRNKDSLETAVNHLREKFKIKCIGIIGDVSNKDMPQIAIDKMMSEFAQVDILVNNSGGPPAGLFHEKNEEDWSSALNLNLLSAIRFCKLIYPIMEKNSYGRIINILSLLAKEPNSNMVLSATSRAGLIAFTKSISNDLGPRGITINNICPGGVMTDRLKNLLESAASKLNISYEEHFANRVNTVPLGRFADPSEIGDLVAFLASEKAGFITGTSIIADGGQSRGIY